VEKSVYDRVTQMLPRGVYLSDEINEFMKQRLLDLDKECKVSDTNKSPIRIYVNTGVKYSTILEDAKEPLDIYSSKDEIMNHIQRINDSKTAWHLTRQVKFAITLAETRAKNLQKQGM
jgi:hypothetical protein